ncbi:hypothetical protein [Peristeroidobacter soli]|uniref:hypothetical protein n=1 Tax=Peristeroidobacter soli TaxID=2497877 RepID=UPI00101BEE1F|nr:hypothetical protein [Peristeroidobacter soli]
MPVDNRAPASTPVDLNTTLAQARQVAGNPEKNQVVLLGADGKMEVHSLPTRQLPGRWTHFKAAFVRVPLLGRLSSVQDAARLIEASNFRNSFRAAVAQHFGELAVADLPPRVHAGEKATVSPKRIIRTLDTARKASAATGEANGEALLGGNKNDPAPLTGNALGRYARMTAIAQQPDYFRRPLGAEECNEIRASARTSLQAMSGAASSSSGALDFDALPPLFRKVLTSYESRLEHAAIEARPAIAAQALEALDNLATIAAAHADHLAVPLNDTTASIVSQLCARAAGPQPQRYSPELAQQAWTDLRDTYEKLRHEVPDMPPQAVMTALRDVTAGMTSVSPRELHQMARNRLLVNEMKRLFDPHDEESILWNAVIFATKDHPASLNAPMTAVMETLAKEMLLDIDFRVGSLHTHFGCEDHLPTVIAKTREKLIENTVAAAVGHLEALQLIEESTTLSPSQKEVFRKYAEGGEGQPPRRLDRVMVEQMIAIAEPMAQRAGGERDPATLFDNMVKSQEAFQHGLGQILRHAETMWISRSLDGTDSEARLVELAVRLVVARLKDSAEEASGPSENRPDADAEEQRRKVEMSIQQFMLACNQSPSMQVAKLAMLLGDMLRVFNSPVLQPDGSITGPPPTFNQIPPELLVRTLAHPSGRADEGGSLDHRGVLADSPNESRVARDFNLAAVTNPERHEAKLERARADGGDGMPAALNRALASADVIVQGQRLARDPAQGNEPAIAQFNRFLGTVSPEVAAAINTCISSHALRDFVGDANGAAFNPPVAMTNPRGSHEVWQDEDGSWLVRSTHVGSPIAQAGKPIHTDGVVLYTLTHRITPPQDGGDARIELTDSNVVFAF